VAGVIDRLVDLDRHHPAGYVIRHRIGRRTRTTAGRRLLRIAVGFRLHQRRGGLDELEVR